jgi:NAD(P)-dependent dehydrogenase (short-subunit alcohol dehydrogenase family)
MPCGNLAGWTSWSITLPLIGPPLYFNVDEDLWHRVMDTNLKGAFFCAQRAAWKMCAGGQGSIINIGSVHSHATLPGSSVYCASKGAINALTRALALELPLTRSP